MAGASIHFPFEARDDFSRLDTCLEVAANLEKSGYPVGMGSFKDGEMDLLYPEPYFFPMQQIVDFF